ncbi:MAG: DUF45 domain-containing protein [Oscillospiraceae bacterium]|nr:DUF45 domain-containing protein [Oscillospiraceae bacterium]
MKREILYYSHVIEYNLDYKNVKNINIRVLPDKTVNVSANSSLDLCCIDNCLKRKAAYILKCFDKFDLKAHDDALQPLRDGACIMYMGKTLTVRELESCSNGVQREGLILNVYKKSTSTSDTAHIIKRWYSDQCSKELGGVADEVYGRMSTFIGEKPLISYRWMRSRWGSCQPELRKININKNIIKFRKELIEFVFCHEFSHLIHSDHSGKFYEFMDMIMPDHRLRKAELDSTSY